MITVLIKYKGEKNNARDFAKEMLSSGLVEAIRKEEGNLRYEYFFPLDDEESVLLVDSWASQEALDVHHQLPLMKQIAALREKYDLHMEVEKYESIDDQGDAPFIRR